MRWRLLVAAVVAAGLIACGEQGEEPEDKQAPGYRQLHAEIFSKSCSAGACHGGGQGLAGLNFSEADAAYERLIDGEPVNGPAHQADLKLVVPGDVDSSYLYKKLSQSNASLNDDGLGARMPLTGERLGPNSLEAVSMWIEAGAPLDGADFEADFVSQDDEEAYVDCDADDEQGMRECFEPPPSDDVVRLYSPPIDVPANSELIACTYLDWRADTEMLVTASRGQQMSGGHHIAVFVANSPSNDFSPHECGNEEMQNYRFVAAAGGGGGQDTIMPDTTALRIREGEQVVLQSHYINTDDEPVTVMDAVDLELDVAGDAETIVDPFALVKSDFSVAPGEQHFRQTKECTIDEEMDIYMLLGHTHDYGVLFELEWLPGAGADELLYHATDGPLLRDSPEIKMYDPPLNLQPGDTLRMTCEWTNTTDHALGWPEEMCVALMYYGPGRGWLQCSNDDEYPSELGGEGEGCADPADTGNALGVGEYCTAGGDECADNTEATFCLAPFDASSNFCSITGCSDDAECGNGATCLSQSAGSACVPDKCLQD